MTEKVSQTFVLTRNELDLIRNKASATGGISDSAALRVIIREWAAIVALGKEAIADVAVKEEEARISQE
jgi:hypothetical protein